METYLITRNVLTCDMFFNDKTDADEAKELIFSSKMKQEALRKEKQDFLKQHEKEKKK